MGFLDFFRSSKKKQDSGSVQQNQTADQPNMMAFASSIGNQNAGQMMAPRGENAKAMESIQQNPAMARDSLKDLYTELRRSQKGGVPVWNSSLYNKVVNSLKSINNAMSVNFTDNPTQNHKMLSEMDDKYRQLISACNEYTSRSPRTEAGIARKNIVLHIQEKASTDLIALSAVRTDFCSLSPEEQRQKDWNQLLDQSRTIHLTVKDFAAFGKETGGQASEVYRLTAQNATVKGADGTPVQLSDTHYFKPEDEYDMSQKNVAAQIAEKTFERFPSLTKNDKKLIREWASRPLVQGTESHKDSELESKLTGLSQDGIAAIHFIDDRVPSAYITSDTVMERLKIGEGSEKVNMTRRNVATSRMAALLGVGNLVAKSETAEIYDEATGSTIRGNLMEQARGQRSGNDITAKAKEDKKTITYSSTKERPDVLLNSTGNFQRDLCSLQVFDNICGQIDRHGGNFLVTQNEQGELSDLQGIDNDGAFGLNDNGAFINGQGNTRNAYNIQTGEMELPFLDRAFAERIKAVDKEMIKYALKDLLTEKEIDAVITRLEDVKKAISTMDESRLLRDEDWNDDTAQTLIDQAWKANQRFNELDNDPNTKRQTTLEKLNQSVLYENYFGELMLNSLPIMFFDKGALGEASPQLLRRKQRMQQK